MELNELYNEINKLKIDFDKPFKSLTQNNSKKYY